MEQKFRVFLNLYDLSQGMARQLSPSLLKKQIDGVWHTGIVVYQVEYYYGGGICKGIPKQTPYGNPVQEIYLGETEISQIDFHEFLQNQKQNFTIEKYDLFKHNCNNFTNECSEFLLGKSIPNFITDLPNQVLNTPLGQIIKPMIDQFTNTMNQQSTNQQMFNNNNNFNNNQNFNLSQTQNDNQGKVIEINSAEQFIQIIEENNAVIFDFFSLSCPPCMQIKPIFAQKAQSFPQIKFCSIDTQKNQHLSQMFEIQAIPTFLVYWNQEQIFSFKGANQQELNRQIQFLLGKMGPQNYQNNDYSEYKQKIEQQKQIVQSKKSVFEFKIFKPDQVFNYYYDNDKLQMAFKKLQEQIQNLDDIKLITDLEKNQLLNEQKIQQVIKILLDLLINNIEKEQNEMNLIPNLDILRYLVLNKDFHKKLFQQFQDVVQILLKILMSDFIQNKNVKLLVIRILVNLQKQDIEKQALKDVTNILEKHLIQQIKTENLKNNYQANVILMLNLVENKYLSSVNKDYMLELIKQINLKENENIFNDDIIRLGISMLLIRFIYKQPQNIEDVKQLQIEFINQKFKLSADQKLQQLIDDILIILHNLDQ